MKKFCYILGAVMTAAAIFGIIAVILKRLKVSFSIEGLDDGIAEDMADEEITLCFDDEDEFDYEPEIETETVAPAEDAE